MDPKLGKLLAGIIFIPILVYVMLLLFGDLNPHNETLIAIFLLAVGVSGTITFSKFLGIRFR